jgi:hypothetical protein
LKITVVSKSPEEVAVDFGQLGYFAGIDPASSSALTQQRRDDARRRKPE